LDGIQSVGFIRNFMKIGQFKGEKDTDIKMLKRVQLLKNYYSTIEKWWAG